MFDERKECGASAIVVDGVMQKTRVRCWRRRRKRWRSEMSHAAVPHPCRMTAPAEESMYPVLLFHIALPPTPRPHSNPARPSSPRFLWIECAAPSRRTIFVSISTPAAARIPTDFVRPPPASVPNYPPPAATSPTGRRLRSLWDSPCNSSQKKAVRPEREPVRLLTDRREVDVAQHLDRYHALQLRQLQVHRLRKSREIGYAQHRCSSSRRRYASTFRFDGFRNSSVPRPNTGNSLRRAIMLRIQLNSDDGSPCCASTFTASYPKTGSMITGLYSLAGKAREKPALRSAFHCMGVRTPFRSPR